MAIRVLVVDDRPDVRLSLLLMLEASGFDVVEAADGAQALHRATSTRVDVILTDLYMPGFDGFKLINAIRAEGGQQPKIIAMSGYDSRRGDSPGLAAAKAIGAEAVLQKPFSRNELLQAMREPQSQDHPRRRRTDFIAS